MMKRTFWIGLLGALGTLPVSLVTVYIILAVGLPSILNEQEIMTRGTHLFYSAMRQVTAFQDPLFLILSPLPLGFWGLLFWLIWRDSRRSGGNQKGFLKGFLPPLLKGLAIILAGWLLTSAIIDRVYPLPTTQKLLNGVFGLFAIKAPQWWSWLIMTGVYAAILGAGGFIIWATLHAAASSSPANRFRPFLVPLVGCLLTLAGLAVLSQVLTVRLDSGRTLKEIPGLTVESRALPGVLVVSSPVGSYSFPGYRGKAVVGFPADAPDPTPFVVPFTESNARLVRELLARRSYWTLLSEDAWGYLAEERWRALDPDEVVRIHTEAFERGGWHIHWVALVQALRTMAPRPEFLAILGRLSNENHYFVGARGAAYLSLAYAGQGAAERAAFWRQRAIASLPPDDYMRKRLDRPGRMPTLLSGSVRGRLLLDGQPARRLRVGLGLAEGLTRIHRALKEERFLPLSRFLVSGGPVDADGRFELKGLPLGDYILLIAWDPEASAFPLRPESSPPALSLTPDRPVVDVGTIRLARGQK